MMDIYGQMQQSDTNLQDLHRRVEKLLQGHSISPIQEVPGKPSDVMAAATGNYLQSVIGADEGNKLSSSIQSSSSTSSSPPPPITQYDIGPPPTYEQHMTGVTPPVNTTTNYNSSLSPPLRSTDLKSKSENSFSLLSRTPDVSDRTYTLGLGNNGGYSPVVFNSDLSETFQNLNIKRAQLADNIDVISNPPLSPISETSSGVCNNLSEGNTRSVSAAVSDESVAGDSGVFEASVNIAKRDVLDEVLEMSLESAQIQIRLKYEDSDGHLVIGIEKARNISALGLPVGSKVGIKAALLPNMNASLETKFSTELENPKFSEVFRVPVPEHKLMNKTLQVNVWSCHEKIGEECLGCAQVSLADFDPRSVCLRWYNVLSFKFMQSDQVRSANLTVKHKASLSEGATVPIIINSQKGKNDKVTELLEASSERLSKDTDSVKYTSNTKSAHPLVISLKEESSDESTIISSQTSTLTRNQGPESMNVHSDALQIGGDMLGDEDDDLEYSEKFQGIMEEFDNAVNIIHSDTSTDTEENDKKVTCDKETNTEAVYANVQPKRPTQDKTASSSSRSHAIRRSQTFSPACRPGADYVCKLNRSDSDSSMPHYKKGPFQRHAMERRSLRLKKNAGPGGKLPVRTSIDLELDLQASQTKLTYLQDEIHRLRELKNMLESAKAKGETEPPVWLTDDEQFQKLLTEADRMTLKIIETFKKVKQNPQSKQDRKAEQLLKRVTKDVQKLKKNTENSNANSFREKMAFFTTVNMSVPIIPDEGSNKSEENPLDDFLKDDRVGQQV